MYGVVLGFLLGALIAVLLAISVGLYAEKQAIKHGCGEYSNTTGKFTWINKN